MKRLLMGLVVSGCLVQQASGLEWLTDLPKAVERATKEKKAVLLNFTGSDWCPWCVKLTKEVFETFEFAAYANDNLVLVEVDFPKRKSLSLAQINANHNLKTQYGVTGYPSIVVIDSDGRQLGRAGYTPGGPKVFIGGLETFPGMPHRGPLAGQPNAASASAQTAPRPKAPAAGPAAKTVSAPLYGELTLKGISGTPNRRLALINNETLLAGETALVKTLDTTVGVTVKEIRQDSVLVVVNGQTRELKLGEAPALR
jgi:protein disulfide-isomerase